MEKILHPKKEFHDVRQLVEELAEMYDGMNAYSFRVNPRDKEAERRTFNQLRDDVRALGSEMIARGMAGKHVVLVGKLTYSWILCYYATLAIGSTLIPLDRDWADKDLADTALRADADFLMADADVLDKADVIVNFLAENGRNVTLSLVDGKAPEGREIDNVNTLVEAGRVKFAENSEPYYQAPINVDDMSLLVFTSGTTGKGKGVMLSQHNILSDIADVLPYIDFTYKTVGVLPPQHTYGSTVSIVGHASIGCEVYLSGGLKYILNELKAEKPGHLVLVPLYLETFYRKIMSGIKAKGKEGTVNTVKKLRKLIPVSVRRKMFAEVLANFGGEVRMIVSGGAAINQEIMDTFETFGITVLNGYGITECSPLVAVNHNYNKIPGSVGIPLSICDIKIDEPNENGEGEICIKGSNVMLGYYKDAAATEEAMCDGYFRTGDYGKIGKKGALFITGRKKNLIILSNGKNVYPEEIENEFVSVPGVQDIIVYEGKSKRGDMYNAIVAEIFPDKEYVEKNNIEDLNAYLQKFVDDYNRTAVPYKKIGILKVRTEDFPKNTLRKIMRFKLDMSID